MYERRRRRSRTRSQVMLQQFDGAFAGGAVRCDVDCLRTRNDDRRP